MNVKSLLTIIGFAFIILFASCKTYDIPVNSFRQQFSGLQPSKHVVTQSPYGGHSTYDTYPIDFIKCVDDKGNQIMLKNGPSIEIRFTTNQNKKTVFYFDLITLHRDTVFGIKSRIITSIKSKISLNDVKRIEVQDGHKKYKYL